MNRPCYIVTTYNHEYDNVNPFAAITSIIVDADSPRTAYRAHIMHITANDGHYNTDDCRTLFNDESHIAAINDHSRVNVVESDNDDCCTHIIVAM